MSNSINCPICGNLCSSQAAACPKCGHPINQTNQKTESEIVNNPSQKPSIGSGLRAVLWIFFAFSLLYALGAIRIYNDMPLPLIGYANESYHAAQFAIAYHIAPLIIMIIILAITYSAKERQ